MSPTEAAELKSLGTKIDDLIKTVNDVTVTMTGTVSEQGQQIKQLQIEKTKTFEITESIAKTLSTTNLSLNTLEEKQKSNLEKIEVNKDEMNKGLSSIRDELGEIENLKKAHEQNVGSQKTWKVVMVIIGLLLSYDSLDNRLQEKNDPPKVEKAAKE